MDHEVRPSYARWAAGWQSHGICTASAGVVKILEGAARIEQAGSSADASIYNDAYSSDRILMGPHSSVTRDAA
ncbi:hypothetical protein [Paraburkholderia strydomiana]|uniref:hypothetical protein n=1 Tax=Paraburkholderia strydomiana TaxID=1245417 RepID=UPI00285CAB40|nr:hypothetical protein [Paraburkholderia strydomiana]MDR7009900.1 hypothetical protein [Paraburkholderia strydomiana]